MIATAHRATGAGSRARWAAAAAGLLLTALLAGCAGGDGADGADAAREPTTADRSSASTGPHDPEPTTSPATPTVAPATGETLTLEDFTITMPAGWKVERESDGGAAIQHGGHTFGNIIVHSFPRIGIDSLDSFVTAYLRRRNHDGYHLERLDNRVIDGVEGYVVQGTDPLGDFTHEYGTFIDDQEIHVAFYFAVEYAPDADPFTVIEPVLATLTWT